MGKMKRLVLAWCVVAAGSASAGVVAQAMGRCRGELNPEVLEKAVAKGAAQKAAAPAVDLPLQPDAQVPLKTLARDALDRSAAVGAGRWLADAASLDTEQTEDGRMPVVSAFGSWSRGATTVDHEVTSKGTQSALGLQAGANLYDGGKQKQFIQWRKELERASKLGLAQAREAVVAEVVTLVLERSRYKMQAQVYQQHARKMSCLMEALEAIVAEDRGRASELVQVRKNQAQAELSRDAAIAQSRQIDLKLHKLLGTTAVPSDGVPQSLTATPELVELQRWVEKSNDTLQLQAQIEAQAIYAKALDAGRMPQVSWGVSGSQGRASGLGTTAWQAGVNVSYNLFDGGVERAGVQAAQARVEAARQQLDEFLRSRMERLAEMHDAARTAAEHSRRYSEILRDSDLLRNYTFQQWSQLGRRSLFDLMSAEGDHFSLRVAYINALYDAYGANAQLLSMSRGLVGWLGLDTGP